MRASILQNSILLVDKPDNLTSFKTVEEVKRIIKVNKIGHSGTLDKFASGLLVLCTGCATRLAKYFLESDKRYIGTVRLGALTDTLDGEGSIVEERGISHLRVEKIEQLPDIFVGEILQRPPVYSALKIQGRRASDLIRDGKDVSLPKRRVSIKRLEVRRVPGNDSLLRIEVTCSKGTYIRSLARDIGEFLETGAYLKELRRVASGNFGADNSISIDELRDFVQGKNTGKRFYYSPFEALQEFGILVVNGGAKKRVQNGAFFKDDGVIAVHPVRGKPFRIVDEEENLLAVAEIDVDRWRIKYLNVFNCEKESC